jgi:two-component system, chemotaxis family, protein-glutamate methylesterase/glutaminase
VVIGASAGGVEALQQLVAGLPADLPAALLVAVHLDPGGESRLPQVLGRHSAVPVRFARNGDPLQEGVVLLAPPDHHLLVADDRVRLSRGPRVNRQRPAVDTLFRSAALARGAGVVAVVLSGALDDGAVGAATVAAQDGVVLVQDPEQARVPSMPSAALASVRRALSVPTAELSSAVAEAVRGGAGTPARPAIDPSPVRSPAMPGAPTATTDLGTPAAVGCPECQGGMFERVAEGTVSYVCHVGHTWSARTLLEAEQQTVEAAIYNAASKLLEMASVHRRLAELAEDADRDRHLRAAEAAERRAAHIQELATEDAGPD